MLKKSGTNLRNDKRQQNTQMGSVIAGTDPCEDARVWPPTAGRARRSWPTTGLLSSMNAHGRYQEAGTFMRPDASVIVLEARC